MNIPLFTEGCLLERIGTGGVIRYTRSCGRPSQRKAAATGL